MKCRCVSLTQVIPSFIGPAVPLKGPWPLEILYCKNSTAFEASLAGRRRSRTSIQPDFLSLKRMNDQLQAIESALTYSTLFDLSIMAANRLKKRGPLMSRPFLMSLSGQDQPQPPYKNVIRLQTNDFLNVPMSAFLSVTTTVPDCRNINHLKQNIKYSRHIFYVVS